MADGASKEIKPSLGRPKSLSDKSVEWMESPDGSLFTDEPHYNEMTFDFLDMIENLQFSLDTPTVEKLCEYFNMTSSLEKIRASDNPQRHFLLECRRKCILTRKDTTQLLEAFRENRLSKLQRIIEDYNRISNCPNVRVTVDNNNPTSAFSNFKTFMLTKKRGIKSVFRQDHGIHFVDCKEGSLVICLKVSSVEELDKLKAYIESGELLRRLIAMYESEISDTERKDFQSERSSIKICYDTEDFENANQQLTTKSFRSSKVRKLDNQAGSSSGKVRKMDNLAVTDEPHYNEMTFDFLDMIESLQFSLDTPTVMKLCVYFNMTSSLEKIRASDNPQRHFLLECRRKCILTRRDTTQLLEAFRENGLSNLQRIIEDYNRISNCPNVRVTVNNDNPTGAFSNFKRFMLSKKRAIKSVFRQDQGIHFVDCKEGSLVICLKVSSVEELDKLKAYIESEELLRRLIAMYESQISYTERKDFQSERSSIKLCYDTEEFENANQQLTTNSGFETRMANSTCQRPLHPIRDVGIVLVGRTGCGRSSTGNTILGRTAFTAEPSGQSVTGVSSYATSEYGDRMITVVDTPGEDANFRPVTVVKRELARVAFLLREGVHCFVICMNASDVRVPIKTKYFLDALKVSGHADFFDYCMLVYTKTESELCDISLNEYVEKLKENADMKSFLENIGDRVLAVNNKARDPREKTRNQDNIIAMVDKVIEDNRIKKKPIVFTNDTFKAAIELRGKLVSWMKKETCHPSLLNAVIEAVIWFSNWGTVSEKEFVDKVINILLNSEQCINDGTNLVFRNDNEATITPVVDCVKHICMIYTEIQLNIGQFYKMLGTILNNKNTYTLTTGAVIAGAGFLAGVTGICAVGAILGVPAVIAYKIGDKMS